MFLPQGVPKSQMAVRDCRRAMIRLQLKTRSKNKRQRQCSTWWQIWLGNYL